MTKQEMEVMTEEMHSLYTNMLASCHNPDFFQGYKLRQQMRHRYHYVRHCVRSSFYPDTRLSYNDTFKRISDILKSGYGNNPNGNEEQ